MFLFGKVRETTDNKLFRESKSDGTFESTFSEPTSLDGLHCFVYGISMVIALLVYEDNLVATVLGSLGGGSPTPTPTHARHPTPTPTPAPTWPPAPSQIQILLLLSTLTAIIPYIFKKVSKQVLEIKGGFGTLRKYERYVLFSKFDTKVVEHLDVFALSEGRLVMTYHVAQLPSVKECKEPTYYHVYYIAKLTSWWLTTVMNKILNIPNTPTYYKKYPLVVVCYIAILHLNRKMSKHHDWAPLFLGLYQSFLELFKMAMSKGKMVWTLKFDALEVHFEERANCERALRTLVSAQTSGAGMGECLFKSECLVRGAALGGFRVSVWFTWARSMVLNCLFKSNESMVAELYLPGIIVNSVESLWWCRPFILDQRQVVFMSKGVAYVERTELAPVEPAIRFRPYFPASLKFAHWDEPVTVHVAHSDVQTFENKWVETVSGKKEEAESKYVSWQGPFLDGFEFLEPIMEWRVFNSFKKLRWGIVALCVALCLIIYSAAHHDGKDGLLLGVAIMLWWLCWALISKHVLQPKLSVSSQRLMFHDPVVWANFLKICVSGMVALYVILHFTPPYAVRHHSIKISDGGMILSVVIMLSWLRWAFFQLLAVSHTTSILSSSLPTLDADFHYFFSKESLPRMLQFLSWFERCERGTVQFCSKRIQRKVNVCLFQIDFVSQPLLFSFYCPKSQYTKIADTLGKHVRFNLNMNTSENAGILQTAVPSNVGVFQNAYKDWKNIALQEGQEMYTQWKDVKADASKPLLDEEHGTDKAIQSAFFTPAASQVKRSRAVLPPPAWSKPAGRPR